MSESDRYVRRSSGLWKLNEVASPESASTPARGIANATKDKSTHFAELARVDLEKGNLPSAETNLRLALTFAPHDTHLKQELKRVVDQRDALRRAANQKQR